MELTYSAYVTVIILLIVCVNINILTYLLIFYLDNRFHVSISYYLYRWPASDQSVRILLTGNLTKC